MRQNPAYRPAGILCAVFTYAAGYWKNTKPFLAAAARAAVRVAVSVAFEQLIKHVRNDRRFGWKVSLA